MTIRDYIEELVSNFDFPQKEIVVTVYSSRYSGINYSERKEEREIDFDHFLKHVLSYAELFFYLDEDVNGKEEEIREEIDVEKLFKEYISDNDVLDWYAYEAVAS